MSHHIKLTSINGHALIVDSNRIVLCESNESHKARTAPSTIFDEEKYNQDYLPWKSREARIIIENPSNIMEWRLNNPAPKRENYYFTPKNDAPPAAASTTITLATNSDNRYIEVQESCEVIFDAIKCISANKE